MKQDIFNLLDAINKEGFGGNRDTVFKESYIDFYKV